MARRALQSLTSLSKTPVSRFSLSLPLPCHLQSRNYISDMRKSAFEGNILRILRTEIQYESEYAPPKQPDKQFGSFIVDDKPGEQWIRLRGNYAEKEDIKIEVTMFDGAIPVPRAGNGEREDDMKLHISLIVDVSKGGNCENILEFICSAWPDSLEIQKVVVIKRGKMDINPYAGPNFRDLDDELQNSLQEYLEVRGVNDDLATFLHEYMLNKDRMELIRWLGKVKSFIEK